jgi:hypothetical protein
MGGETMAAYAWEVSRCGNDSYSVRFRRESGVWETPSYGGWKGREGALHALYRSGVTDRTAIEMLAAAVPGKLVRLEGGEETFSVLPLKV